MKCILCVGSEHVTEGKQHHSMALAIRDYRAYAEEMQRYGSTPECGFIHIAKTFDEAVEDPDRRLELSERGALIVSNF